MSKSSEKSMRCNVCERYFDPATSTSMPFCSPRCKTIDLGRWLDERYSVPYERTEDDEEDEGPPRKATTGED
jgi:endogenous inhibitor of DNA gyrase (YacG/DUF329 family)